MRIHDIIIWAIDPVPSRRVVLFFVQSRLGALACGFQQPRETRYSIVIIDA